MRENLAGQIVIVLLNLLQYGDDVALLTAVSDQDPVHLREDKLFVHWA